MLRCQCLRICRRLWRARGECRTKKSDTEAHLAARVQERQQLVAQAAGEASTPKVAAATWRQPASRLILAAVTRCSQLPQLTVMRNGKTPSYNAPQWGLAPSLTATAHRAGEEAKRRRAMGKAVSGRHLLAPARLLCHPRSRYLQQRANQLHRSQ